MSYNLFLDDERYPGKSDLRKYEIARNFDEAVEIVTTLGWPRYISFDHDLGPGKSGADFAQWLVQYFLDNEPPIDLFSYYVHSQNPVGADNICGLMEAFLRHCIHRPQIPFIFLRGTGFTNRVEPQRNPPTQEENSLQNGFIAACFAMRCLYEEDELQEDAEMRREVAAPYALNIRDSLLQASRFYGLRFVSIAKNDLVGFGGITIRDNRFRGSHPTWRVAKLFGIMNCGNGPQAQIYDFLSDFPHLYGTYNTETKERIGAPLPLSMMVWDEVNRPIPEGAVPNLKACRYIGFR